MFLLSDALLNRIPSESPHHLSRSVKVRWYVAKDVKKAALELHGSLDTIVERHVMNAWRKLELPGKRRLISDKRGQAISLYLKRFRLDAYLKPADRNHYIAQRAMVQPEAAAMAFRNWLSTVWLDSVQDGNPDDCELLRRLCLPLSRVGEFVKKKDQVPTLQGLGVNLTSRWEDEIRKQTLLVLPKLAILSKVKEIVPNVYGLDISELCEREMTALDQALVDMSVEQMHIYTSSVRGSVVQLLTAQTQICAANLLWDRTESQVELPDRLKALREELTNGLGASWTDDTRKSIMTLLTPVYPFALPSSAHVDVDTARMWHCCQKYFVDMYSSLCVAATRDPPSLGETLSAVSQKRTHVMDLLQSLSVPKSFTSRLLSLCPSTFGKIITVASQYIMEGFDARSPTVTLKEVKDKMSEHYGISADHPIIQETLEECTRIGRIRQYQSSFYYRCFDEYDDEDLDDYPDDGAIYVAPYPDTRSSIRILDEFEYSDSGGSMS
jgi:hypothetical protein